MGILLLLFVIAVILMIRRIATYINEKKEKTDVKNQNRFKRMLTRLAGYLKEHYRISIALAVFFAVCVLSIFPMVTFNDVKLFGVPYPSFIRNALGIFRSNGRFIWVAVYLLMLGALVLTDRYLKKTAALLLVLLALLLQLYDFSGMIKEKRDYFVTPQTYENLWDSEDIQTAVKGCNEFVFLYNENDIIMDTAYYASQHGMRLNNYYYARDIDELVEGDIAIWKEELKSGIVKRGVVYIFKKDELEKDMYEGLEYYELDEGHVIGVAG